MCMDFDELKRKRSLALGTHSSTANLATEIFDTCTAILGGISHLFLVATW